MSATAFMSITHIEQSQSQKEVTMNAALDELDKLAKGVINVNFNGGGSEIPDNQIVGVYVPWEIVITGVVMGALDGNTGSLVADVWSRTYASFPPSVGQTITASAKPTISSGIKSKDTTLTGWTTTVPADSYLFFHVDSCTTLTDVNMAITFYVTGN